ncbi:MAG: KR domain-containing protein, partial [Acidobacteriota bacterium]
VTDPQQMAEAIRRARQRFGEIHGVVHLAGELQRAVMPIAETDPETSRKLFAPKVRGTLILDELLADSALDFCLLFSSLSSVLGGLGFASYAAANAFLDAWAHHRRGHPVPWMSVSWDGWRFRLGEPLDRPPPGEPRQAASEHDLVMEPAEGVEAFRRVLSLCRNPQIVVSTGDLEARIATWVTSRQGAEEGQPAREKSAASAQRPQLSTAYVPPGNAIEEALVAIWQQEIGFEQVGIHDRFFELGGDSLLGIQVISRCRQAGFELTPKQLFEQPTIAELAKLLADADGAAHEERPADTGTADAPAAEAAADSDFSDSGLEPEQLQKVLAQLAELP